MKVGLLGRNISYSRSPEIHNNWYKERHIPLSYSIFDVKRDDIPSFVESLEKEGIIGFNVTVPYKEHIMGFIHELHSEALEVGAVNTVVVKNGWRIGYCTDVHGFEKSLEENGLDFKGKKVLILGSGGAARAVYTALKHMGAEIHMSFRSEEKKVQFPESKLFMPLAEAGDISQYAMVVNCTKLGNINDDRMPIEITGFSPDTVLYDLNYEPKYSAFLRKGKELGLRVINGESMLRNQAMKSIEIWTDALKQS